MKIATITLAVALIATPALADNVWDMNDNPNSEGSKQQREISDTVRKCERVYDAMFQKLQAERDKVFYYAHDYNAKDGYILNSSLNIFVRDTRLQLQRAREEFHRMYHRDGLVIDDCIHRAYAYEQIFDCFYDKTTHNDVYGMESCNPALYQEMDDPYRYYGGKAEE